MILAKPTSTIRNFIFISIIAFLFQGCFLFGGGGGNGESARTEGEVEKALSDFRDGKEAGLIKLLHGAVYLIE